MEAFSSFILIYWDIIKLFFYYVFVFPKKIAIFIKFETF